MELGAEILSADSRQIFRGMDIGTAKPSPGERALVTHHLIDELDLHEPYSAGIFARMAEQRIARILQRGPGVLVVGGSTLYLHALLHGLADIPHIPSDVRRHLNEQLIRDGSEALYRELCSRDPAFAATLDATKTQRIIRGLEVSRATGKPISSFFRQSTPPSYRYRLFVLDRPRSQLYARIDRRVDAMMNDGLLEEVRALFDPDVVETAEGLRTIGYRELIKHLRGEIDLARAVELVKRNSRRYAKRQLTWFRKYQSAEWIDLQDTDEETALRMILSRIREAAESEN
jgi:tRNA dimethylallyltransferase